MVDDKAEDTTPSPDSGRAKRPPPTIDLEASEVSSETRNAAEDAPPESVSHEPSSHEPSSHEPSSHEPISDEPAAPIPPWSAASKRSRNPLPPCAATFQGCARNRRNWRLASMT